MVALFQLNPFAQIHTSFVAVELSVNGITLQLKLHVLVSFFHSKAGWHLQLSNTLALFVVLVSIEQFKMQLS